MDPETGDARPGPPPSRTCTMSRSPDQWTLTWIRSSRPSPACRILLLTSSETSNWASKASGSGNRSWPRARRALRGAVRVGRRLKSSRRGVPGAACWSCLTTVTTSLPCLRRQGRGFPPEILANQRPKDPRPLRPASLQRDHQAFVQHAVGAASTLTRTSSAFGTGWSTSWSSRTCKAAVDTSTTAGPATAGHPAPAAIAMPTCHQQPAQLSQLPRLNPPGFEPGAVQRCRPPRRGQHLPTVPGGAVGPLS
jgi:hypothetical protein